MGNVELARQSKAGKTVKNYHKQISANAQTRD